MAGGEVEVVDVLGVDVGDAPPVPDDLHRLPKASQLEASFNLGEGGPGPFQEHVRELGLGNLLVGRRRGCREAYRTVGSALRPNGPRR